MEDPKQTLTRFLNCTFQKEMGGQAAQTLLPWNQAAIISVEWVHFQGESKFKKLSPKVNKSTDLLNGAKAYPPSLL